MADISRLRSFVREFAEVVDAHPRGRRGESGILSEGSTLLTDLLRHDDWLPDEFAEPAADTYQNYLLHCDSRERFVVVSYVWGPGQATPVHDHLTWGLIGVLRGQERSQRYTLAGDRVEPDGEPETSGRGVIDAVSPRIGDIHQVCNPSRDEVAISIHVYGANIGGMRRHRFDPLYGMQTFSTHYSQAVLPNLWDRSQEFVGA